MKVTKSVARWRHVMSQAGYDTEQVGPMCQTCTVRASQSINRAEKLPMWAADANVFLFKAIDAYMACHGGNHTGTVKGN